MIGKMSIRCLFQSRCFALTGEPKRMLILGGGIIGLEMGTVYSTLGTRPTAKNSPLKKQAWP